MSAIHDRWSDLAVWCNRLDPGDLDAGRHLDDYRCPWCTDPHHQARMLLAHLAEAVHIADQAHDPKATKANRAELDRFRQIAVRISRGFERCEGR